ncbi:MAG: hypothetical protein WBH98_06445 [Bacteroidales bacterium]
MCVSKCFKDVYTNYSVCDRRRTVSIKEKGKNYIAKNINLKQIAQYHIDAPSVVATEEKRCDYAIYIFDEEDSSKNDDRLIFIELKGSDLNTAVKQIRASIKQKVNVAGVAVYKIDARVITSKTPSPKYKSTEEVILRNELNNYGKGKLIIKTKSYTENI